MKKIIIPIGALLMTGMFHAQLSTTENYVYSRTILDYNASNVATKTSETVQYFDGLGRPKQVVNIKASPQGKDVVTSIEYDGFGRQVKDYLPVPQSNTLNGAIVPTPLANVVSTPYGQEKIYAEKTLENSPLDRLLEQKQVGTAWNDKPVRFQYDANIQGDYVRKYEPTTTWDPIGKMTVTTLQLLQYFLPNTLYKNTVTDEDGNKTIEFKNGKGQVVLVRKVISPTENADTYYVYNEYNQLAFVIPPASPATIDDTASNNFCYQYRYDGKGRLVEKKLPGKGWEYIIYDKADRVVMTQDANLKGNSQWLVTEYDAFNRIAYTGLINNSTPRNDLQTYINNNPINNAQRISSFFTLNGMNVYYTSSPTVTLHILLSVNYYDTYPTGSPAVTNAFAQDLLTDNPANKYTTKGLPVASYVKNIEDDNWTKNFTWYDTKGRVIGSNSKNHLGGYTVLNHNLDFSGIVLQTNTYHKRLATDTEIITRERFTYDPQNRLLTRTHQVNNNPIEILAQNDYNELSQLRSKKVGGVTAAAPLQQIDYKYNIRGWMTQINDPATLGTDLFGYKIKYNQVEGQESPNMDYPNLKVLPKFNGNIAEVDWKTSTIPNDNLRRYGYIYDNLNRLLAGFYQKDTNPSGKEYFEMMDYDRNGNITNLKRSADILSGDPNTKLIDNLIYDYSGNRLTKVTEQQQNSTGYPYFATPNTIGYDLNGNMTIHKDKGINDIKYNFLNLPNKYTYSYGSYSYKYRTDGVKVEKESYYIIPNSTYKVSYLDGFQYSDYFEQTFGLDFVPTSEGYFNFRNNKYIYNYTDHLGNVRLSYSKNTSGIEIIEENNYYPFGLKHEGYNTPSGGPSISQYKYNGKELQENGMYDYGVRMYMPDLGRWGVIDPLAELYYSHSPFNYVGNNPIIRTDPFGMDWYTDKDGNYQYDPKLTKDNSEKYFKDNRIEGGKYFGISGNVDVFSKDSNGNRTKTLSSHKLNEDGSVMDLLSGHKLDGGTGFETEMGFSINAYDDKPDPYYFAGGEQWQSNDGNTYRIQFGEWTKLSGVTVNYDAYNSISSLGYVPSSNATYGDYSIMRNGAKKTLNDAIGLEGLVSGTAIEAIASKKISAPNPITLLLGAVYNMYSGMIDQVSTDIQRDKSIKDARK